MNAIAAFDPTRAQRRWLLELLHGIEPHNHCQGGHLNFGGTRASVVREGKRRQIASLKTKIKARLAATMDVAERQSLYKELELADLRLELIAAKEDPGDL